MRLKHCVIVTSNISTIITFRLDFIRALRDQGIQVTILSPRDKSIPKIQEKLDALGVKIDCVKMTNTGLNPFKDFLLYKNLTKKLQILQPDIVFSYTIKPVIYGSLAAFKAAVPKITSMMSGMGHLYTLNDFKTRCLRLIANILLKQAFNKNDTVFFQNTDDAALCLDLGLISSSSQSDKVVIVPGSGVNLDIFARVALPKKRPLKFLFIGRLLKTKGFFEFCQAAAAIKKYDPTVQFEVLGGHHPNPAHLSLQQALDIMKQAGITYLGEVDDVRPYIAAAHGVVLPSYREGTPKSLLEALSIGRPIITTDVPGCRSVIAMDTTQTQSVMGSQPVYPLKTLEAKELKVGRNGILVPACDAKSLEQAFKYMVAHPEILEPMGVESRQLAERTFDVRIVNGRMLLALGINAHSA